MERYERQAREAFWMLHNMLRQGPVKEMDIFSYLYIAVNPSIISFRIDQVGIYRAIMDKCRWEETHPDSILWVGLGTNTHLRLRLQRLFKNDVTLAILSLLATDGDMLFKLKI